MARSPQNRLSVHNVCGTDFVMEGYVCNWRGVLLIFIVSSADNLYIPITSAHS